MSSIGAFKHDMLRVPTSGTDWTVLSLTQPWASALFMPGLKRIETRSWRTNYRGRLYIHAAKGYPGYAKEVFEEQMAAGRMPPLPIHRGCIIGHVELDRIEATASVAPTLSRIEESYGDYAPGRFAWFTHSPVLLDEPIPAKGQLGLWRFTPQPEATA